MLSVRIGDADWSSQDFESIKRQASTESIERRVSLFHENSVFVESNSSLNKKKSEPVKNNFSTNHPKKGKVSISTVFVAIFLTFVTMLGVSLISVSIKFSSDSNALLSHGSDQAQRTYMDLVQESNARLMNASNFSVNELTRLILQQVNERVEAAVTAYTGACQFSVLQMSEMLEYGELNEVDMDFTTKRLWRLYGDFPTVSSLIFSGWKTDNWIVLLRDMVGLDHTILVRNTTGTICRKCEPGASDLTYIYSVPNMSRSTSWAWTGIALPADPVERPWFIKGVQSRGAGCWTAPYTFDDQGNIGITAARLARDETGAPLGVVGADLTLADMSTFLRLLKSQLDVHVHSSINVTGEGFQMVMVHEEGSLLATSTGESLSRDGAQLDWQEAIRNPLMRAALGVVSAACGGNWSALFTGGAAAAAQLRVYPANGSDILITTRPYSDGYGLRIVLLSAVPVAMYRQDVDEQALVNILRIRADTEGVARSVAELRSQVNESVRRNWTIQLVLSVVILVAGTVLVYFFATRVGRVLLALAAEMERVARLDLAIDGSGDAYSAKHVHEVVALSRSFALMEMNLLSFSRYVPEGVVRLLASKGTVAHLGVAPRDVSVMFSDIVGFSTLAETLDPGVLISMLAEYLDAMSVCVEESAGTVGKFIGDAIMAFWNSPGRVEAHAHAACACALRQQRRLAGLREKWAKEGLPEIRMRLGLSCGTVLHGNVGSSRRMEWT